MSHLVIGTAGHIDHGKTSLVRALTGIDTDRLKEEKQRGITIELGFAHLDLPGMDPVGIVDVPGHEKFVHHMVAGVAGIDLVLLVIAADEGVMPQTREHLDICRLLGVQRGLVALTKVDMVEPDWLELVKDDVAAFVAGTFLEGSPLVPVSSATGAGLEDLRNAIAASLEGVPSRASSGIPRLPVDRVFTMKGFGTVVTGTLIAGALKAGETVELLPSGGQYRVRGLQVHGESVDRAVAGQRTAVNLQGAEKSAIVRGETVTVPGAMEASYLMDGRLSLLKSAPRPLASRARVRLHLGTSEILARVVILGRKALEPGQEGMVQFRLEAPGVALPRDRFVVRSYSPVVTVGGGEMIDTHPAKHRQFSSSVVESLEVLAAGDLGRSALLLLDEADAAGEGSEGISRRLNIDRQEAGSLLEGLCREGSAFRVPVKPPLYLHHLALRHLEDRTLELLAAFHGQEPLKAGLSKEELRSRLGPEAGRSFSYILSRLQESGKLAVEKDLVRLATHKVTLRVDQEEVKRKVESYYRRVGLQPPVSPVIAGELGLEPKALKQAVDLLVADGILVKVSEEMHLHSGSLSALRDKLVEHITSRGRIDMQGVKEVSGLSRKYTIPLMEYFDRSGLTIRVGDHRVLRKPS